MFLVGKKGFPRAQNLDKPDDMECKFLVSIQQHSILLMIKVRKDELERIAGFIVNTVQPDFEAWTSKRFMVIFTNEHFRIHTHVDHTSYYARMFFRN